MTRLAGLTWLVLAASAAAAERPTDAAGDPLPEGALARLGTLRFRHAGEVSALAFSPDGKRLARGSRAWSSGLSNAVRIWSLADGKRRPPALGHEGEASALAFSPDGRRLASGGRNEALLWDVGRRGLLLLRQLARDGRSPQVRDEARAALGRLGRASP
jgi:WD40 repeat protein